MLPNLFYLPFFFRYRFNHLSLNLYLLLLYSIPPLFFSTPPPSSPSPSPHNPQSPKPQHSNKKTSRPTVTIRLQPIGSAPQLRQKVFKISAKNRFETVVTFLRNRLFKKGEAGGDGEREGGGGGGEHVFCYVNSVFAPGLDEGVGALWRVSFFFFISSFSRELFLMILGRGGKDGGREREETGRFEWIRGEIVGGCERCDVGEGGRKGSGPCMEGQCGLWIDDLC